MKSYNVNCIKKDTLILTGKGDSPFWDNATILTDFVSAWDSEPVKKIEFKALHDSANLFFCFKVYDNEVHIDAKDDSVNSIGNSDRVELFFRTDAISFPPYFPSTSSSCPNARYKLRSGLYPVFSKCSTASSTPITVVLSSSAPRP